MPNSMTRMVLGEIHGAWRRQDLDLLASYLPEDFHHDIVVPKALLPQGGLLQGKSAAVDRLRLIADAFEIIRFDTGGLLSAPDRAAAYVPIRYWHRRTGRTLETVIGMFWKLEEGWPTHLVEYHDIAQVNRFLQLIHSEA
ncbi:hypothetical protein A7A08_02208 [Methyloligella halotolerans]|uniref:SnoaL-like domain-containing protein n=1 Tax=Methyloligella halotolerans TaxID=1177755 RepID=A0A1E2RXG1_9HYPH|nr:nuclear transport factor 2 family protein [Methyloligella halotolerans]ODA66911.1 hypothetical protein A7A08_02208 [Methyloligella halotolerans]